MINHPLDFNTRKALCAHLGNDAGKAIADLLLTICRQIETLERNKSDASTEVCAAPSGPSEGGQGLFSPNFEDQIR